MKKTVIFILISFLLISCKQNTIENNSANEIKIVKLKPQEKIQTYIQHPKSNDQICPKELERAKKDFKNGELVFSMPNGEGDYNLRQEKYIRELCKKYNLIFKFEMISDAIIEEGRQGCYGAYMDNKIAEKYGEKFKQFILDEADKILIKSNDTVSSYDCDKKPIIFGISETEEAINVELNPELKKKLKPDNLGYYPTMDIVFYIDKDGKPNGYHLEYFNDAENKTNQNYKQQLLIAGIDELKKYQKCISGEIKGQKVITENRIRAYF